MISEKLKNVLIRAVGCILVVAITSLSTVFGQDEMVCDGELCNAITIELGSEPVIEEYSCSESAYHYLELAKQSLTGSIYQDPSIQTNTYDQELREYGKDWPRTALTMIGLKRLDNIQQCVEDVLANKIPGDFIETGVWRGGATIFMRAVLKAYGDTQRRVWVADSFEGDPVPNVEKYPVDAPIRLCDMKQFAVSLEEVQANFASYDLLDDQVQFLKGWFSQTLPTAPIHKLAILRLDGNLYESTMDALVNLYPKLSIGGYVIIDDYKGLIPACAQAVNDYRIEHNITEEMELIDDDAVYWKRVY